MKSTFSYLQEKQVGAKLWWSLIERLSCRCTWSLAVLLSVELAVDAANEGKKRPSAPMAQHPEQEKSKAEELERLTESVSKTLPASPAVPVARKNFIDEYIFRKIELDKVPHALLCSDTEFLGLDREVART